MDGRRLLGIYLDDHLAVFAGGEELAKRMLAETKDDAIRRFLEGLLSELRDDRAATERLLAGLGRRPNAVKQRLAWLGEKVGRLKLNGNATGYSPLSRLVELEAVSGILGASRSLWRALALAGPAGSRDDASTRAERVDARIAELEPLRLEAVEVVFTGGERRL
jgi:hypothetical protein